MIGFIIGIYIGIFLGLLFSVLSVKKEWEPESDENFQWCKKHRWYNCSTCELYPKNWKDKKRT